MCHNGLIVQALSDFTRTRRQRKKVDQYLNSFTCPTQPQVEQTGGSSSNNIYNVKLVEFGESQLKPPPSASATAHECKVIAADLEAKKAIYCNARAADSKSVEVHDLPPCHKSEI